MINDENPLPAVCFIKKTKGDRFMNKKIMYIRTVFPMKRLNWKKSIRGLKTGSMMRTVTSII